MKRAIDMRSDRINLLRRKAYASIGGEHKMIVCNSEAEHFARIVLRVARENCNLAPIEHRARLLTVFANEMPCSIDEGELIIGSGRFNLHWRRFLNDAEQGEAAFHSNIGHIIVDYGRVLNEGVDGLQLRLRSRLEEEQDPHRRRNLNAFIESVRAFSTFIRRHAQAAEAASAGADTERAAELAVIAADCMHVAAARPQTFRQALQLVWFIQVFLHAEGSAVAFSFGRFDQYLWPFLREDIAAGRISEDMVEELLGCFFIKCCEGDESQNLTLGGRVESEYNTLSLLCLKAMKKTMVWQPSLSVRVGPHTPDDFWRASLELCATGSGMPSFFNDDIVTRSLENLEIPHRRAADWGIVGCYEANPSGDTYGMTVGAVWSLSDLFVQFFNNSTADDFQSFYTDFICCIENDLRDHLPQFQKRFDYLKLNSPSPFESTCLTGCIESALAAEEGGASHSLFGVNVLGFGTVIDCLHAVNAIVFEGREISLVDLQRHAQNDFADGTMLQRLRSLKGKYGSNSPFTNQIAADLSQHVCSLILGLTLEGGVRCYPGLFAFSADIYRRSAATPDGRRSDSNLSYGAGPGVFVEASATEVLASAANIRHDLCPCGNPILLSLDRADVQGEQGLRLLRSVIETYFQQGGFHLHFNITNADTLRAAQQRPEENAHMLVRVSGFSARFLSLDRKWQDALIERTEKGV